MVEIPILAGVNWASLFGGVAKYLGYGLFIGITAGVVFIIFYLTQFTIKAEVFKLYGSGTDGVFAFSKPKKNRIKWIKNKTAWKPLYPLMNKMEIEPFDQEYMLPGNSIKAFDFNGAWIPGRINIKQNEKELRAEINPVPHYVRNWQSLQHKKHAQEFAEHSFWEDNKYFIMGVASVLVCCVLCGATIYFTYQFAGGGTNAINGLTAALKGFGASQGVAPQ